MQGKIIKGIAGFYYVDVAESGVYAVSYTHLTLPTN